MKSIPVTLLFTLWISFACGQAVRPQTPEALGQQVFESLQNKDLETFKSLIFTNADCDIMANSADAEDSLKADVVKQMYSLVAQTRHLAETNFKEVLAEGEAAGINWLKAELLDVDNEIDIDDGIESADVVLLCDYKNDKFIVVLTNCHKSDAWLMMDKMKFIKQKR